MKRTLSIYALLIFCLITYFTQAQETDTITKTTIGHTEKLLGLELEESERDSMLQNIQSLRGDYEQIRGYGLKNSVAPALLFNPLPQGFKPDTTQQPIQWQPEDNIEVPENKSKLAFMPVYKLASLLKNRKITSTELTGLYLDRLKKYSDTLRCLVTLTEDLALKQARKADAEIANGNYRGPLHGIPYGVKDLLAVKGYKTTWGAMPYRDQQLDETATVVKKLEEAGAVLVAKLSMGALAMGDVWYGGVTKNPWDLEQGSSGSSAGSAAATSAGLVGFSIGTETYGSIVSPSTRCGVTGLRPTFGRVSRAGAMALSWSMDKIGPICRSAKDCAMVLDVIKGVDAGDPTTRKAAFNFDQNKDIKNLKVAYIKEFFYEDYRSRKNDSLTLAKIRSLGMSPEPVEFPDDLPVNSMLIILDAEAAAAFDQLTLSDQDSMLRAQHRNAWPNIFRYSRFIPAVEYVQANRLRSLLIEQIHEFMQDYDVVITPSFGGNQLLTTNLTGHPCVVIPNGFDEKGHPTSISFIGNLYDEASLLEFTHYLQQHTQWEEQHPAFFK
ncbi:MAG: amidase [Bacteroidales bacterium]|nr:amidase [Bacteroidales bacterium]